KKMPDRIMLIHSELPLPLAVFHAIIVTEYLDASLQQLWTQQGHKPMKVGRQIGSAIEVLHSKKVVHHDVKTMKIMCTSSDLCKRLSDLGLAKKMRLHRMSAQFLQLGLVKRTFIFSLKWPPPRSSPANAIHIYR